MPTGRKLTEKQKRKISEASKVKKRPLFSEETRKRMSEANKGKPSGFLGKKHSGETKKKMSEWHKGKKMPEETKEKIRQAKLGKKLSKEEREKISERTTGEKCHFWQGGKSFEPYPQGWTNRLRESIRERDNYVCQLCGVHQDELNYKLHCHHIDYDKNNLDPKSLISLCMDCHLKTNLNRGYWIKYFLDNT